METTILESCHSTWVFDTDRMRFRRIIKEIEVEYQSVATEWRPYYLLQVAGQGEAFTVHLNASGTRLIRSWRHTEDCAQCGGHVTAELSLKDLRDAISA